jgi:hypothetical protein
MGGFLQLPSFLTTAAYYCHFYPEGRPSYLCFKNNLTSTSSTYLHLVTQAVNEKDPDVHLQTVFAPSLFQECYDSDDRR